MSNSPSNVSASPEMIEEVLFLPGIACQVQVGVTDDRFRDRLQRAAIGRMHPRSAAAPLPVAAKELAEDLCVPPAIMESALLTLEQEGAVQCRDGLFTLSGDASSATLRDCTGWMFWNCLEKTFLPLLLLDAAREGLPRNQAPESDYEKSKSRRASETIPLGAMHDAARDPAFEVARLTPGGSPEAVHQVQVRCLSAGIVSRPWPLASLAEIRPRFGGTPGIFLHDPQAFSNWSPDPQFASHLLQLIEDQMPDLKRELLRRAQAHQTEFLRENSAEFLAKLGGEQKVIADAEARVQSELSTTRLAPQFSTADLKSAARDAELNLILFQHDSSLVSEASIRRDFAAVLQGLGAALADLSAAALQQHDTRLAANARLKELKTYDRYGVWSERDQPGRNHYWTDLLNDLQWTLKSDFRDWQFLLSKNLSALNNFLRDAATESRRQTLGIAFACWCAVPLVGQSCPTAKDHLQWMRSALAQMSDLPSRYAAVKDTRNVDKALKTGPGTMPLETFRAEVYALWRAFGRDWR